MVGELRCGKQALGKVCMPPPVPQGLKEWEPMRCCGWMGSDPTAIRFFRTWGSDLMHEETLSTHSQVTKPMPWGSVLVGSCKDTLWKHPSSFGIYSDHL